ncbi:hypothetical protein [Chitinophaga barathri]|uniref:Uncharacterized protein n=1 Tax=Chitinophaga barathri TaxID=1647451 RepID=A0A3N4MAX5_9BACT|nr:hypothetical protein [Chitinophaga barathri]RPD40535.1 hypothetical protein EG028_14615 [Chitinophaga barathri]
MQQQKTATPPGNPLAAAYQNLAALPKIFLDLVCNQLGWSEATFYRRMKTGKPCSKAEHNAIRAVYDRVLTMHSDNETSKNQTHEQPNN